MLCLPIRIEIFQFLLVLDQRSKIQKFIHSRTIPPGALQSPENILRTWPFRSNEIIETHQFVSIDVDMYWIASKAILYSIQPIWPPRIGAFNFPASMILDHHAVITSIAHVWLVLQQYSSALCVAAWSLGVSGKKQKWNTRADFGIISQTHKILTWFLKIAHESALLISFNLASLMHFWFCLAAFLLLPCS